MYKKSTYEKSSLYRLVEEPLVEHEGLPVTLRH
jgi:hypothetical protein